MRSISFANHLTFRFSGNLHQRAIALGDVDGDKDCELVIGNIHGELGIFKGATGIPAYICSGLGTITAVAIGDALNCGKSSVICVNAEGDCHVFHWPDVLVAVTSTAPEVLIAETSTATATANPISPRCQIKDSRQQSDASAWANQAQTEHRAPCRIERPNFTVTIPVNVGRILIGDVDGDGFNEIVLGRTDRVLHTFRLRSLTDGLTPWKSRKSSSEELSSPLQASKQQLTVQTQPASPRPKSACEKIGAPTQPDSPQHRPRSSASRTRYSSPAPRNDSSADKPGPPRTMGNSLGAEEIRKWQVDGQVGSLAMARDHKTGSPLLLVSQPGGTLVVIDNEGNKIMDPGIDHEIADTSNETLEVAAEVVSGLRWRDCNGKVQNERIGMITMDGVVTLLDLDESPPKKRNWDLNVRNKLFALAKIDLAADGCDVLLACAWDGNTFAIDQDFNVLHYEFPERVCAFTAAEYAVTPGRNVPCLFYVNFEDQITVFPDVRRRCTRFPNLDDVLRCDLQLYADVIRKRVHDFDGWVADSTSQIPPALSDFLSECLYDAEALRVWKAERETLRKKVLQLQMLRSSVSDPSEQETAPAL